MTVNNTRANSAVLSLEHDYWFVLTASQFSLLELLRWC